jgi:hypothetical protein
MTGGKTNVVERKDSGAICGEPLDPACDPVNAIETEPWNPACVVAAVGLVHLGHHGRLVEICGERIRTLYSAPDADSPTYQGRAVETEPFYGLVRAGNTLWAAGVSGIYRIQKDSVKRQPLPRFQVVAGLDMSLSIPGLVVLRTNAHPGMAVGGGGVPALLPR